MDEFWINRVPCRGVRPGLVKHETEFESDIGSPDKRTKKHRITREVYALKNRVLRNWFLWKNPPKNSREI